MHPLLSLLIGLILAGVGGELFVKGVVGLAKWARIPAGIIGATVAAFATSSPELAVAIQASLQGTPTIALGDALGSNVVNVGLVLGIALLFGAIKDEGGAFRRELPLAIFAPLLLALLILDGQLTRVDGIIILAVFLAFLVYTTCAAWKERQGIDPPEEGTTVLLKVGLSLAGLACLIFAGGFIVEGAKFIGEALGWSTFVVGATLVALGTSMPELATTVISRIRGHDDIGLGTILGSNIFNGLFIVGVAIVISPFAIRPQDVVLGLGSGLILVLAMLPNRQGILVKSRGFVLLAIYAASVALLIFTTNGA
ncbi:MAG: sodium:calcium antiporter [Fimbriimonadaceae bacterium]|jgi:cation:H+ antiporter|nr:sodium:calcium antiporter [Fimbriimonadaceae bacterium]